MQQRGFTLIEILVTVFVIAMVVATVGLNLGDDPRFKQLAQEGKRLKFFLEKASDEAVFQNIDLGFYATQHELHPYEWALLEKADADTPDSQDKWGWRAFESRHIKTYVLPEYYRQFLQVDGQSARLQKKLPENQEDILPHFFMAASGEQQVVEFEIVIEDVEAKSFVRGEGVGRFVTRMERYDAE